MKKVMLIMLTQSEKELEELNNDQQALVKNKRQ